MTPIRARARCLLVLTLLAGCGGEPDAERTGSSREAVKVCPDAGTRKGIDVSFYQGAVSWSAVAADGIDFAVARTNHGSFIDPEFDANWAGIRDAGLVRGAYQYFDPGGDPIEQADVFIAMVGELGPGDLPPVLDVESTDGLGPNAIASRIGEWVMRVENALGRKPIIYTGSYFWNDNVKTDAFDEHPLWIAHYGTDCPNMPDAWEDWAIWQYTSTGSVAGIAGAVDVNHFNGHKKALNDLAANGWRAEVVSLSYPAELKAGETGTVELELRNLGARTWSEVDVYLGTTVPRDRASVFAAADWVSEGRVVAMPEDVLPEETVTLVFAITAPAEPGSYTEHFNLVKENVAWFSDIVPGGGPSDDAIALDIVVTEGDSPVSEPGEPAGIPDRDPVAAAAAHGGCNLHGRESYFGAWWLVLALVGLNRRRATGRRLVRKRLVVTALLASAVVMTAEPARALSKLECEVKEETGYTSGNAFPIKVITVDGELVERNTANAYFFMAHAAASAGVEIRIVSGFRTMAEQQYLYNCYVNCSCNNCNLAATPGYSNHQSGSALDLNTAAPGVYGWLDAHAHEFDFVRTVPGEPWHWEYVGDKPVGGPCGTLKAELMKAWSDAQADETGNAEYRVCAGDSFALWFDLEDVGTARWADRGLEAKFPGEGVGLEPAEGGVDVLTGLGRVSLGENLNANVHPKSWGGTPGGACNDAPKCRRTVFTDRGIAATAPREPGIYTSSWQLHDHTPAESDRAFGPVMELSFLVEDCAAPADPTAPEPGSAEPGSVGGDRSIETTSGEAACAMRPPSEPMRADWLVLAAAAIGRRRWGERS